MSGPSRETLQRLEGRHGFTPAALEIVVRLLDLLRSVGDDPVLGQRLVLKGGTALNLCFGAPERLSVDLDFNDIGAPDREARLRDRPLVLAAVERIARRAGYRVQRSREEHAGQKLYLGYVSAFGNEARIQVDLNFIHRVPLEDVMMRQVWSPDESQDHETRVVGNTELIAGKVLALLDRSAPRDLYDIARLGRRTGLLGKGWDDRGRRLFIALSAVLDRPLSNYGIERLDRVTDDGIRRTLHPLLREDDRPVASELRGQAREFVEPLLALSQVEHEYVERVQVGDFEPELLFPAEPEIVERLRLNPALRWKIENARAHSTHRRSRLARGPEMK